MHWVATDKGQIHKATTGSTVTCWGRCCGLQAIDVNPNMVVIDVIELVTFDHIELYGNDMIGGITIVGHWKGQGIGLEELLEALSLGVLGSKDLGFYVFRTLMCIVGKP